MKQLASLMAAVVLWHGGVPEYGMQEGRLVKTDDGIMAERKIEMINDAGDVCTVWTPEQDDPRCVFEAAVMQLATKQDKRLRKVFF